MSSDQNTHARRNAPPEASLSDVHRSVRVRHGSLLRRIFAFAGPAYMISVGYMDPGNWATDLEGGARFGYRLIWVLLLTNIMAVLLQALSARLGIVTGRDLAQACRENYPRSVNWILFGLCEIAIGAMDLAELLGTAIGLNLLFGIPLTWAVLITGADVLILLGLQRFGIRKMEAFILSLVFMIGLCFVVEMFIAKPSLSGIASGFIPHSLDGAQLYIAIGILGATVMPHNLYLHSSLVQTRNIERSKKGIAQACRFNLVDTIVALNAAFFVNASILILAAAVFWKRDIVVNELQQAHSLLDGILGSKIAPIAFGLALLCAGQASTLTGTLAGQITMTGFLRFRMRPWLIRLLTRLVAIVPAVFVIWIMGDSGSYRLLILSQVILSLQLPFAVVPLIKFTSSKTKMGPFVNKPWVKIFAWVIAGTIIALNVILVIQEVGAWTEAAGRYGWMVLTGAIPLGGALGALLLWLIFHKDESDSNESESVRASDVLAGAAIPMKSIKRVGVALEAKKSDAGMLARAVDLARTHKAELVLIHIVEGVGGQWYGQQTGDLEAREDERYLEELASKLSTDSRDDSIAGVHAVLGFGDVARELVRIVDDEHIDVLVVGGHGHKGLADVLHGQTIPGVRHGLDIPIFAVKQTRPDAD
ncbi:MAG TPA: divalent metal cation transporter MntH [Phycisphaerales bacterium]|nr:divalent metal cation transporter MntH [Phycisphaerales bacterium]